MNKQSLAPLIVGVLSVGSGLWVSLQLRIDRCLDLGGQWSPVLRACRMPPGVAGPTMNDTLRYHAIGGAVAIVFAYMLLRMYAAVVRKNQRLAERDAAAGRTPNTTPGGSPGGSAGGSPAA